MAPPKIFGDLSRVFIGNIQKMNKNMKWRKKKNNKKEWKYGPYRVSETAQY